MYFQRKERIFFTTDLLKQFCRIETLWYLSLRVSLGTEKSQRQFPPSWMSRNNLSATGETGIEQWTSTSHFQTFSHIGNVREEKRTSIKVTTEHKTQRKVGWSLLFCSSHETKLTWKETWQIRLNWRVRSNLHKEPVHIRLDPASIPLKTQMESKK